MIAFKLTELAGILLFLSGIISDMQEAEDSVEDQVRISPISISEEEVIPRPWNLVDYNLLNTRWDVRSLKQLAFIVWPVIFVVTLG